MREIKFRVWDNSEKEFLEGWRVSQLVIRPISGRVTEGSTTLDVTLLQYTGLKDKHGKDMYEGDIVERKGMKYIIALEIGSFMLVKIDEEKTDMYSEFVDCWNDHVYPLSQLYWNNSDEGNHIYDLEITGNFYENPELLDA